MKDNYSIAERNRIVEEYLYCIDRVIRRNSPLMRAAHLDYDDVYQDLAIRLIRCVSGFDPEKGELEQHIMAQLQYEMLNCKDSFILGAPGQAKSYAINALRGRITGARQFERLLSKQTDEEQLFGRVDLSSLIPGSVPRDVLEQDDYCQCQRELLNNLMEDVRNTSDPDKTAKAAKLMEVVSEQLAAYEKALGQISGSEPKVNTAGKIPDADICFLDEIFKCNDGVLNSLLTALNERKYTNEGHTYSIPTISFFAASNEVPNFSDPQENILEALYDRLELKMVTANIEDRDKRLAVLRDKQAGRTGQIAASVTLDELKQMQEEVANLPVPEAINELADDILCQPRRDEITVPDRKYLNYYPIAQARAWLSGHTQSGAAVASFSVACDRDFKDKATGERATDFIDVVAWRATGEFVSKYFTKGRMAVVSGRLQIRDWTDKEGGKRRSAEVIAENVYFGDSKSKEEQEPPASTGGPVEDAGRNSFGLLSGFPPNFGAFSGENDPF